MPLLQVSSSLSSVLDTSHVEQASRFASDLAVQLGLDDKARARAASVVEDAGRTLLKHAPGGDLFVGVAGQGRTRGLQILAMDRGRGLPAGRDPHEEPLSGPARSLRAIEQAATTVDQYSAGDGTVLAATVYAENVAALPLGGICVAAHGCNASGDGWAAWEAGALTSIFVCDGMGVGNDASAAARAAIGCFRRQAERPARYVIEAVDTALRGTRGAAVALAELDYRSGTLRYCALGAISAFVVGPDAARRPLASVNGIAGQVTRPLQIVTAPWTPGSVMVVHSNGLSRQWSLARYPGLAQRRADVIAGVLLRDYKQTSEDATVVVARYPADA